MSEPFHKFYERVCEARPEARVPGLVYVNQAMGWHYEPLECEDRDGHPTVPERVVRALCLQHWMGLLKTSNGVFLDSSGNDHVNGRWSRWMVCRMDQAGNWYEPEVGYDTPEEALGAWLIGSRA